MPGMLFCVEARVLDLVVMMSPSEEILRFRLVGGRADGRFGRNLHTQGKFLIWVNACK